MKGHEFSGERNRLRRAEQEVERLEERVERLEAAEKNEHVVRSATLIIVDHKGEPIPMPLTVHLLDTPGSAVYQEFDALNGQGDKVPPVGQVVYTNDSPSVCTIDPATGALLKYLSVGTAVISASDDGTFPASDTLTIIANLPASATLTLVPGLPPVAARQSLIR